MRRQAFIWTFDVWAEIAESDETWQTVVAASLGNGGWLN